MGPQSVLSAEAQRREQQRIYDLLRDALLSVKYYANTLEWYRNVLISMDVVVALAASSVAISIWQEWFGIVTLSVLSLLAGVVSALKPVLRIGDRVDRYTRLHLGWHEIYLDIEALVAHVKRVGFFDEEAMVRINQIDERYRRLGLTDDPKPRRDLLEKYQKEVNEYLPSDKLWMLSTGHQ